MIIGLTGNSGSGKSSVADIMRDEYGAYIIDADKIAHEVLLKSGPAYDEVVAGFGEEILSEDGEIERCKLGTLVFGNDASRGLLVGITHKYIVKEMLFRIEKVREAYPYVIMDAPLLIEAGLHKSSDKVWLVYAPAEVRLERIITRDGLSEVEGMKRINSQTGHEELKKYADVVIDNSKGRVELRAEVKRVISKVLFTQAEVTQ